jgi:hypothetical protein
MLAGATAQSFATGRAEANIAERQTEKVAPQFLIAHAGGYDDVVAEWEKGKEGQSEAMFKSIAVSATELVVERLGAKMTLGLRSTAAKEAIDYMSTNQFLKRSFIAKWARDKNFTSADEMITHIQQLRAKGQFSDPIAEWKEEFVTGELNNLITGDREMGSTINLKEQGTTMLSVLLTSGVLGGASYVGRKISVKAGDAQTILEFETKDKEKVYQTIDPKTWKKFNSMVSRKEFTPDALINFFEDNQTSLPEQQALAEVYTVVNTAAKDSIEQIKKTIEEFGGQPVTEEQLRAQDIEVETELDDNEETPEEKQEDVAVEEGEPETEQPNKFEALLNSLKDIDEEPTQETNDTENQTGLPSEVGAVEEPIQAEPIQETGSQEIAPSGMVQEPSKQISVTTVEEVENERDMAINELATRFQKVDTNNEE